MSIHSVILRCQAQNLAAQPLLPDTIDSSTWIEPWLELGGGQGKRLLRLPSASSAQEHRHWSALASAMPWIEPLLVALETALGKSLVPNRLHYLSADSLSVSSRLKVLRIQDQAGRFALIALDDLALSLFTPPKVIELAEHLQGQTQHCTLALDSVPLHEYQQWQLAANDVFLIRPSFLPSWNAVLLSPLHQQAIELELGGEGLRSAILRGTRTSMGVKDAVRCVAHNVSLTNQVLTGLETGGEFELPFLWDDFGVEFLHQDRLLARGVVLRLGNGLGVRITG